MLVFAIKLSILGAVDETIPLNHLTVNLTSFHCELDRGQCFGCLGPGRTLEEKEIGDLSTLLETSPLVINADLLLLWTFFPVFMD